MRRVTERMKRNDDLAVEAQAGSIEARNTLIEENLGAIKQAIGLCRQRRMKTEEYFGTCVIALIDRLDRGKFDRDRGTFTTFLSAVIRRVVHNADIEEGLIRLPNCAFKNANTTAQAIAARSASSISGDDDELQWDIDDPGTKEVELPMRLEELRVAFAELPPRTQEIMRRRLRGDRLVDVGRDCGLVKERVRQIQYETMERLERRFVGTDQRVNGTALHSVKWRRRHRRK